MLPLRTHDDRSAGKSSKLSSMLGRPQMIFNFFKNLVLYLNVLEISSKLLKIIWSLLAVSVVALIFGFSFLIGPISGTRAQWRSLLFTFLPKLTRQTLVSRSYQETHWAMLARLYIGLSSHRNFPGIFSGFFIVKWADYYWWKVMELFSVEKSDQQNRI